MPRRLLVACLLVAGLGPAAGAQMLYSTRPLPTRAALGRLGLERFWFGAVPLRPGLEQVIHLSMAEDLLFVQTSDAVLHAFEAETGRLLWTSSLGSLTGQAQDVAVNSKFVFASNAGQLQCLDRRTGKHVWTELLPASAASATTATEDEVMLGLTSGQVIAYGLEYKGEDERFRPKEGPPGGFRWAWSTTGPVTARPIATPYVVAFASTGGKLYAARREQPEILHRSQPMGPLAADMSTFGTGPESTLYVPSTANNLYAVNLFTGEQDWIFPAGAPIRSQPLIGDYRPPSGGGDASVTTTSATIFVLNELGILHAIDLRTGRPIWDYQGARTGAERVLAVGATKVYLQSAFNDLVIVDRATGAVTAGPAATRERAGLDLREYSLGVANDENDRIYLSTPFGILIGVREIGAVRPTPLRDPREPVFGAIQRDPASEPIDSPPHPPDRPFDENADDSRFDNPRDLPF